jgi:hypothetical protein
MWGMGMGVLYIITLLLINCKHDIYLIYTGGDKGDKRDKGDKDYLEKDICPFCPFQFDMRKNYKDDAIRPLYLIMKPQIVCAKVSLWQAQSVMG